MQQSSGASRWIRWAAATGAALTTTVAAPLGAYAAVPAETFTNHMSFVPTTGTGPRIDPGGQGSLAISPRPGVHLVFGPGPDGKDSTTVSVPATGGNRSRSLPLTVINTSPGPMTVDALTFAGESVPPTSCAGSTTIASGAHLSCSVGVDAPAGTADTTLPFRAYVRGTSAGVRVEDEALGRWSFTAPTPAPTPTPTPTPTPARDASAWTSVPWPRVVVDDVRFDPSTPTWAVFTVSDACAEAVPETLGDLLAAAPATGTPCAAEWRLTRAATAAVLNEATLGANFPAASELDVVTRTNATLTYGTARDQAALAAGFEAWNTGSR